MKKLSDDDGDDRGKGVEYVMQRWARLWPHLFISCCFIHMLGWHVYPSTSPALFQLERGIIASLTGMANVFLTFGVDHGYFAGDAQLNPITHLWTLGVEFQFAPLIVVMMMLIRTLRVGTFKFLLFVCLVSFLGGQMLLDPYPAHAYYLLFPRCAELFAGCLAFVAPAFTLSRFAAPAALLLLLLCSYVYSASTPYPGLFSLVPALCSMVLLRSSLALLDNWLLRQVGALSYGILVVVVVVVCSFLLIWPTQALYLVHWPILAYSRLLQVPVGILAILLTWNSAWLLHSCASAIVDSKVRVFRSPWTVFVLLALLVGGFGARALVSNPPPARVGGEAGAAPADRDEEVLRSLAALGSPLPRERDCFFRRSVAEMPAKLAPCYFPPVHSPSPLPAPAHRVVFLGDSICASNFGVVETFARALNATFWALSYANQPVFRVHSGGDNARFAAWVKETALQYDAVILASRWQGYTEDALSVRQDSIRLLVAELVEAGKPVLLLGDTPQFMALHSKMDSICPTMLPVDPSSPLLAPCFAPIPSVPPPGTYWLNPFLQHLAFEFPRVVYWDASSYLCNRGQCLPYLRGYRVYFDGWHYTYSGARILGCVIVQETGVPQPFKSIFSG